MNVTTLRNIIIICSILIGATACSGLEGDPQKGERWYTMHNCDGCHGPSGNDGGSPSIKGLTMGHAAFIKRLRKKNSVTMPPYPASKISEQDAADLLAYIKTL